MPDLKTLKIVHVTRAPVGGIFRHILDVAQRPSRARPPRRHRLRQHDRRRARRRGARRPRAAAQARRVAGCRSSANSSPTDLVGFMQVSRHLARAQSRRAARPRRQGRRLRPADVGAAPRSASTRRTAARCTTAAHAPRHGLWRARALPDAAHRAVPVRERVCPQRLPGHGRRAARHRARRAERHQRGRDGAGRAQRRRRRSSQRRRIPPHQGHRRADRRRGRTAPGRPARSASPSPATARKARRCAPRWRGLGSTTASASSATRRRGRPSRTAGCWWCRRARTPCPMS